MEIYLLRHGETDWNKENRLQGHNDIPLNERGRQQVLQTGLLFAGEKHPIDQILASPLKRAHESGEILANCIGFPPERIVVWEELIERNFGAGEGLTWGEIRERYPTERYPGMETVEELCDRARRVLQACAAEYPGRNLLLAAHGAIINGIITVLTEGKVPYDNARNIAGPASLAKVVCGDGRFWLEYYDYTADGIRYP